jgi:Flp pilus assembly protein TadD
MSDGLSFTIAAGDFDASCLPPAARNPCTDAFRQAVSRFFEDQYRDFGGWVQIAVDPMTISVAWRPDPSRPAPLEVAVAALKRGEVEKGIRLLEVLRRQEPDRVEVLYNLGAVLSDQGRVDEALRHLRHAAELQPSYADNLVAMGVALVRQGKLDEAVRVLERAVLADPANPWAHRNLGACLLKTGDGAGATKAFRTAVDLNPQDQQAVFGLAEVLREVDVTEADRLYIRVIELDARSQLAEFAREARTNLSQQSFRGRTADGVRPDAVMYLLGALKQFGKMPRAEVQQVAFEIAVLGQRGLDPNDPEPKYQLRSLPGSYSGLHLLCLMFAGFKVVAPGQSIGFDLAKEYEVATAMFRSQA